MIPLTDHYTQPALTYFSSSNICWRSLGTATLLASLLSACGGGGGEHGHSSSAEIAPDRARALASKSLMDGGANVTTVSYNTIVVRGSSTQSGDVGALIQVRYNGLVVANDELRSTTTTDMVFNVPISVDGGLLDIVFTNASNANGSPVRQLRINAIVVNGTTFSPLAPGVTYDRGHYFEAFDGLNVIPGTNLLTSTGALRIPMPGAGTIGTTPTGPESVLSASPGVYVDIHAGADTNPGTIERPFKTLGRLSSVRLIDGENIHLRCGNLWRESLELGTSQLANGTRIQPYGNDCAEAGKPVITGADQFNGSWTKNGAIWSRTLPSGTPQITRLFVGYTAMRPAQWPNAGQPQVLIQAASAVDPARFTIAPAEASAVAGRPLAGATALIRTQPWRIESRQLASQGSVGDQIVLATRTDYPIVPGDSWLLRDKLWMLDAAGEFFHDVAARRLYLIPANADATLDMNALNIEASVRDVALALRERSRLSVKGLALRLARQDGLRITDAPEISVLNVESRENGLAGIRLQQWQTIPAATPGPLVENSLVAANGESGIEATYVQGARILGNHVLDTGVGVYTAGVASAIAAGPAGRIEDNVVEGAGYVGISFSSQLGSVVARNEVSRYCQRLSDCGAIYSWTAQSNVSPQQSSLIENNRIFAATAAVVGSPAWGNDVVAGIYLDDFSQRATVRNNFVHSVPMGIFLHNTSFTTVENNQIWLARRSALWVAMDRTDSDWSRGNVLRGNQIVPMTTASATWPALPVFAISHPIWFGHALAGTTALSAGRNEFIENQVVQLHGVLGEHALISGPTGPFFVDAANWLVLNTRERAPDRPLTFATYYLALGPEKLIGGQFDSGLGQWGRHWNNSLLGFDLQPTFSQFGCEGPCVRMTVADTGDMLFSPVLELNPGVPHLYRWTAVSTGARAVVSQPYISRMVSPWDQMSDTRGFVTLDSREVPAGQTKSYEAFFTPKSGAAARVNVQLETVGVPLHMDAVSVREILGWHFSGPQEWVATVIAARDVPRVVTSCGDIGWPAGCQMASISGVPISPPFIVPAGGQQMVMWANSPYRR